MGMAIQNRTSPTRDDRNRPRPIAPHATRPTLRLCSFALNSCFSFPHFRFQAFAASSRHLEKPVQGRLPGRQLRLAQAPPLLHLRHEPAGRFHRRPPPRTLAKRQLPHHRQPIRPLLQVPEPDLGENIRPVGEPEGIRSGMWIHTPDFDSGSPTLSFKIRYDNSKIGKTPGHN